MSFEGPEKLLELWFLPVCLENVDPIKQISTPTLSSDEDDPFAGWARKRRKLASDSLEWTSRVNCSAENVNDLGCCHRQGLRRVERKTWQKMLDLVKCQILSVKSNNYMDTYLLSESSLFVYPHRVILKTCGTTTLLLALPRILEIAQNECALNSINKVFYSRKNFLFPEKQQWPHQTWEEEVKCLDNLFDNGSAYVLGKTNKDHWYLYIAAEQPLLGDKNENVALTLAYTITTSASPQPIPSCLSNLYSSPPSPNQYTSIMRSESPDLLTRLAAEEDQTIEIMMTELDSLAMRQFYCPEGNDGGSINNVEKMTGLVKVYEQVCPETVVDSYLFQPCGWSVNGLATSMGPYYWTIHVTPEDTCSYASFETNIPVWQSHHPSRFMKSTSLPIDSMSNKNNVDDLDKSIFNSTLESSNSSDKSTLSFQHKSHDDINSSYAMLINQVVDIFRPGKFSVSLFRTKHAISSLNNKSNHHNLSPPAQSSMINSFDSVLDESTLTGLVSQLNDAKKDFEQSRYRCNDVLSCNAIHGYNRVDNIAHEFDNYELLFCHYTRI